MKLVVSGPGGVGKGTLIRRLIESDPNLWLSRSWTTRAPRPGEADDAYTFVDKERFLAKAEAGGFLEWATVLGEYYGSPVPEAPDGMDVVLEIDVQGARQVRDRHDDVFCVLVVAPSPEAQEARLRARGDDEHRIERRIELGRREVKEGEAIADAILVNDDLTQAVRDLEGIVAKARAKFRR